MTNNLEDLKYRNDVFTQEMEENRRRLFENSDTNFNDKILSKVKRVHVPFDYKKREYLHHINILRKEFETENGLKSAI